MNPYDQAQVENYDEADQWREEQRAARSATRKPYRPVTDANDFLMGGGNDREGKGPWIVASFDSECPCGEPIFEGDIIRADGSGDWEGQECCG